ncbi:hypothetical protein GCM10023115_30240 [Pontixanthobacter gangjinensis]|uniref:DUF423 domain-containing protein n=1 Tax=Christiangramia aestuarii TaxID=1028746 RepID=A0A7K1LN79_9FLAO|nr:DUF423 domain-containing protein [Christiangramia aestuarii]MUP42256.1 DUF423 domain-containing protein [Christiangramia aestuarii]
MNSRFLITGAIFGLAAVILGAFAAHGLKSSISAESLNSFETGVRFQMYHAFLLLIIGGVNSSALKRINWIFYLLCSGVIFFSGSIYLLSTGELTGIDFKSFALVTPLGGSLLILGWLLLLLDFIKLKKK